MKKVTGIKFISLAVFGWMTARLDVLSQSIIVLCAMMLINWISEILALKKKALENPGNKKYSVQNKRIRLGIYKKAGYVLTLIVAGISDFLIYHTLESAGIEIKMQASICLLITVWFIINELLSILRNVGKLGVRPPAFLKKYYKRFRAI